ncbi:hypothetical protein LOK74_04730 [Brevibacillus humidisoli]|uniref:hypothetical protein n=1 Tax=Brevibacillus humidisoli TaxID=2895522 RepID=UPI001E4CD4BF|nr:hypothetical protein [Brevibacillus humidisoli]UFJ41813.1 hypothetical protein LOK74_04730 [Brevibacillus humidisoli]
MASDPQPKQKGKHIPVPVEALEEAQPSEASGDFGPEIGVPTNYEANQVGTKKSLTSFEAERSIGRL